MWSPQDLNRGVGLIYFRSIKHVKKFYPVHLILVVARSIDPYTGAGKYHSDLFVSHIV